jgi:23S rRNA (adenine2030-N6)-methyltransferase
LGADAFIHIDPYLIFEPNEDGDTYVDVFLAAAGRGLRCMLWYGYFTGDERARMATRILVAVADHPEVDGARLYGAEIAMGLMQPDAVIVNPGIVGCGVLTANLSARSREAIAALSAGLVAVYAEGVRFEGQPGRLVRSELDLTST